MIETHELKATIINNEPLVGDIGKTIIKDSPLVIEKTINQNGVYNASDDEAYGYSKVNVNIPGPTGEINIVANGIYDVTEKASANVNVPPTNMWSDCGYSETPQTITDAHTLAKNCYDGWNSSWTKFNDYILNNYTNLLIVPMIDTSNITTFTNSFKNCANIVDFPLLNTSKATGFSNVFNNCTNLQNVPVLDTSKADNFNGFFSNCKKLSETTLNNILIMCINATAYKGTKTLYYLGLRSANYSAATIQALPKYQEFITAGWIIGY